MRHRLRIAPFQPPYGPHVPDSLRRDGWWLDLRTEASAGDGGDAPAPRPQLTGAAAPTRSIQSKGQHDG